MERKLACALLAFQVMSTDGVLNAVEWLVDQGVLVRHSIEVSRHAVKGLH